MALSLARALPSCALSASSRAASRTRQRHESLLRSHVAIAWQVVPNERPLARGAGASRLCTLDSREFGGPSAVGTRCLRLGARLPGRSFSGAVRRLEQSQAKPSPRRRDGGERAPRSRLLRAAAFPLSVLLRSQAGRDPGSPELWAEPRGAAAPHPKPRALPHRPGL